MDTETEGAWVIHHGRKLALDTSGSADFPAIDEAAKASNLLMKLGEADQVTLTMETAQAIARASGINPRYELDALLNLLAQKRLVDKAGNELSVLGVTTRASVRHAADLFRDANPSNFEQAALNLAESASDVPIPRARISEKIGDEHQLASTDVEDFLNRAEQVGFVDSEGSGQDKLLFNGHLFRRGNVDKTYRVMSSLTADEQIRMRELDDHLASSGCLSYDTAVKITGQDLMNKLVAAGVYDLNGLSNEDGEHVYVTAPSAFHKYVNPMIDDCFDMAKALVSALTYGINVRSALDGRLTMPLALLRKMIAGREVGPAPAIGQDYKVLEVNRVVHIRRDGGRRFYMRLLKPEVGELALHVLAQGNAAAESLIQIPSAAMASYLGPEENRDRTRKNQSRPSKFATRDILEAVRGGKTL